MEKRAIMLSVAETGPSAAPKENARGKRIMSIISCCISGIQTICLLSMPWNEALLPALRNCSDEVYLMSEHPGQERRLLSATDLEAVLDKELTQAAKERKFSGAILVAQDGRPLFRKAYGFADWTKKIPNTPETSFLLYSNTKQFTAASILILQDRGQLSVSDPINKHLPGCPPEWKSVTIHHVLSHTS